MNTRNKKLYRLPLLGRVAAVLLGWALLSAPLPCKAQQTRLSFGQLIYVPAYAYVHIGTKAMKFPLTTTLLFHNTSPETGLTVTSIKYYDSRGKLVEEYAPDPIHLAPLAALDVPVKKPVMSHGSGSCFVISWSSPKPISPPLAESVMIGATGQQGISYRSTGQVIRELK